MLFFLPSEKKLRKKEKLFLEEAIGVPTGDTVAREEAARHYKSFSVGGGGEGRVPREAHDWFQVTRQLRLTLRRPSAFLLKAQPR